MNFRNIIISEILKYNHSKCSEEELKRHKKKLMCKSNSELYNIYDIEIRPMKEHEVRQEEYIKDCVIFL